MAFGVGTINAFGGAASDLLGGEATAEGQRITAGGMDVSAAGMRLNAKGFLLKAQGDTAEAEGYGLAGDLAQQNLEFTKQSTALTQLASDRAGYKALGTQSSQVAGAGMANSGSAIDLMRDSASQAAITTAVAGQQGLITEAGYKEQVDSFDVMRKAALSAATANEEMAGDQENIAGMQDANANAERALADRTESNSQITSGFKAAAGIASLFF